MAFEFISVERAHRVTKITLRRPEVRNPINPQMHDELEAAFDDFARDDEQFIGVVTGAGPRAFCVGSDLKGPYPRPPYPADGYGGLCERFDLDKPLIAAVNGFALGGGFEIALACDIIVAESHATFGLPEPLIGSVALGGGVHRLVRQVGLKRAMGILLTSQRMAAAQAYEIGIVNEVVPAGELESAVTRWCDAMLAGAPLSRRATKQMAQRGLDESSLESALSRQAAYPAFRAYRQSEDLREGVRAFQERRSPVWQGR